MNLATSVDSIAVSISNSNFNSNTSSSYPFKPNNFSTAENSADAKANVKSVWFEGEHVKLRAGANVDLLCDNKILSDENALAKDFNKEGIVLVQNTNMMDAENNTIATMYFELDTLQSNAEC